MEDYRENYWGRVYCPNAHKGIIGLGPPDDEWYRWYDEEIRPAIMQLRDEKPEVAKEICRRISSLDDYESINELLEEHVPELR